MTSSHCDEKLLSSIASLSLRVSLKSGTLELPNASDPNIFETIFTPEPTLPEIQSSSSSHTSTLYTQPTPLLLKLVIRLLICKSHLIIFPTRFFL